MMTLPPPRDVPFAILAHFPELLVLDDQAKGLVKNHVQDASGFSDFLQIIQKQGQPSATSGWARLKPITLKNGQPAMNKQGETIYRYKLSDETLKALPPFLAQVLRAVAQDLQLKGLCWTVQEGVAPGVDNSSSSANGWSLKPVAPRYGIEIGEIGFDGSFSLSLKNDAPRHLGVYGVFLHDGQPVQPPGWTSRLPAGVPHSFESDTLRYLGLLPPATPVAAMPVPTQPQTLLVPLPGAADEARVQFGGLGNGEWQPTGDALGAFVTAILDCAIPAILLHASAGLGKSDWFNGLLTDAKLLAQIITAGSFIISENIPDTGALFTALASKTAALLLDDDLADLRKNVNKNVGDEAVENAAPFLGWAFEMLAALAGSGALPEATSRVLSTPATLTLDLSPNMITRLQVDVAPDADHGEWPDSADHYCVDISYANGCAKTQSAPLPKEPPAAPISVTFSGVRTDGAIRVKASIYAANGWLCASGATTVNRGDTLKTNVPITEVSVPITAKTRYTHKRKLTYDKTSGKYVWTLSGPPTATQASALHRLVNVTLHEWARCVGYTWQVSAPDGEAGYYYLFQSITVVDLQTVKSLPASFRFSQQPYLVYDRDGDPGAARAGTGHNFYLDPRAAGGPLRSVALDDNTCFDLQQTTSWGQFREPHPDGIAVHQAGYAIAISRDNSRLEIVALPDGPLAERDAPLARLLSGQGEREGLLSAPVGLAITPQGVILVLENDNARVQALDVYGNPVPCFNQSPFIKLTAGASYLDIAVSPQGLIYILSTVAGSQAASDCRLDIYDSSGAFLARTEGVHAGRIAVDAWGRVYTLNWESFIGAQDRPEPSISQWVPSVEPK